MIFLILSVDDMNFFSSASSIFMISYTHCCCKFALLNVFDRKGLVWLMPVFKIWLVLPIMPSSYSRAFNLSKRQGIERGGVPVGTFYYIVIEVCSCQKKKKACVANLRIWNYTSFLPPGGSKFQLQRNCDLACVVFLFQ